MTDQTLKDALTLTPGEDGALTTLLTGAFSNGPQGGPPEAGFPFGGLIAALAARGMSEGLSISAPLRTLTVQFLAAARFERTLDIRPRLTRGGRRVAYASAEIGQTNPGGGERLAALALATYGGDSETVALKPLAAPPPSRDRLDADRQLRGPMAPWFTHHVDYVFEDGPNILGGNQGRPAVERLWMRTRDGAPLDTVRLAYLLDALYPPAWTAFTSPPMMTSVDLRYDILRDPAPALCPDGWAFFEFRMLEIGGGWTVDDCTCWGADGTPIALARQRRKLL